MLTRNNSEAVDRFISSIPRVCPRFDCGQAMSRDLSEVSIGNIYFTCRICARRVKVIVPQELLPEEWRTTTLSLRQLIDELINTPRAVIVSNNLCDVCMLPFETRFPHKKRHTDCRKVANSIQKRDAERKKKGLIRSICRNCNTELWRSHPISFCKKACQKEYSARF